MMHMNSTGIATGDRGRAFAGTVSFGRFQNGRVHTVG